MSTLTEIEAAVPNLTAQELEQLEMRVREVRRQRSSCPSPAPTNLAEFAGTLRLTEDPLEWQRRVRAEWG